MGFLPEGDVLRIPRRQALLPLAVGLIFLGVGIWAMRMMAAKGDAGGFMIVWGSVWFLGSGAAVFSGLTGLLRPPVFAVLTDEGVTFPSQHIGLIRWRDLAGVRLGLRTVTRDNKTTMALRTPLILTVRDSTLLKSKWKGFTFTHPGQTSADGTAELLLKTEGCPISNEALIAKLGDHPGVAIDLRPADPQTATLGGVKLNQPPRKKGWIAYLGAGVFVAFGLTFMSVGAKKLVQANASRDWPATQAEILSAEIETSTHAGGRNGGGTTTSHTPHVTYRYTVNGRTYTSDRAAFFCNSSAGEADKFIRQFPPGARVTAYYDPQKPTEAVLVHDGYGGLWIFVAFGALFAAVGGYLLKRLIAGRRRQSPA